MPFLTTALAVGAIASGVAGAGASIAGSKAQAGAAESAAQLQADEAAQSLAFQKQEWQTQQTNEAPFLAEGQQAAGELQAQTATPGQGLLTPWTDQFTAPTAVTEQNDPGYQARLQMGQQTLENSAASRGGLLTGGTAKDLTQYAQDFASNEYSNVYSRALGQYQQAYNIFQNNQANTFNRLSTMAGGGQTTAANLGQTGQAAASGVSNINLTTGAQQGQDIQNAAAATASGYTGAANSLTGATGGLTGALTLQQLLAQNAAPARQQFPGLTGVDDTSNQAIAA